MTISTRVHIVYKYLYSERFPQILQLINMGGTVIFTFLLITTATLFTNCSAIASTDDMYKALEKKHADNISKFIRQASSDMIDHLIDCRMGCNNISGKGQKNVCGNDICTYTGPEQLQCYQGCGIFQVKKLHDGKCIHAEPLEALCPKK